MAVTSVNDVGSLIGNLDATLQKQMVNKISNMVSKSDSSSFESIMKSNIKSNDFKLDAGLELESGKNKNAAFNQKKDSDRIAGENKSDARKTSDTDKSSNVSRNDSTDTKKVSSKDEKTKSVDDDTLSEEELQAAIEKVSSAINEILAKIEEIMGMSLEEVNSLLEQMGLNGENLLTNEGLSAFVLQAIGAEDSLALLTDESKYEQFQELKENLKELLDSESGIKDMTISEVRDILEESAFVSSENENINSKADIFNEEQTTAAFNARNAEQSGDKESSMENGNGENAGAQAGAEAFNQFVATENVNVASTSSQDGYYAQTQEIANQILDYIKSNIKADTQTLEMQLHPASLGNVQISLINKGGNISASFIAQNEQVKSVIESQMIQLQERFEEQGIKVTSIEVSVGTHGFEENLEQDSHREEQRQANEPRRVRRLQLNTGFDIEDITDEEERLNAEMLAASGGTMDLQA